MAVTQNVERIAALFPNCVTERKGENGEVERAIDFDMLRQELSRDIIDTSEERYQFTWPGKREAIRLANAPTNCTLRPVHDDSVDFDTTQNLYIEGDNLEVLKLLRETYLGKVKMIYIDPPYNTGNDFVYEDDFAQSYEDFKGKSGMFDEDGNMLLDIGFRVLRLDSSNMEDVYYTPDKFDPTTLTGLLDNVKTDRNEEDLLFQVMLELDVPLSASIQQEQFAGKDVFVVADGHLIVSFDKDVNESTVTEIAKRKPNFFVMRDASAANDNVLDNFEQIFRHYSPDTICKIL